VKKKLLVALLAALVTTLALYMSPSASPYYDHDLFNIYAEEYNQESTDILFIEDLFEICNFQKALNAYFNAKFGEEFMGNYRQSANTFSTLRDSFPVDEMGNVIYPSFYGGSYLNHTGKLVTLIVPSALESFYTDDYAAFQAIIASSISRRTQIRNVEFSLRELREISRKVGRYAFLVDDCDIALNAWMSFICVVHNRVFVVLHDSGDEQKTLFRYLVRVHDHPAMVLVGCRNDVPCPFSSHTNNEVAFTDFMEDIESCTEVMPFANILNPGSRIQNASGGVGSIGYRARRGSINGFVTVAHLLQNRPGNVYFNSSRLLGNVSSNYISLVNDGAFVALSGNNDVSDVAAGRRVIGVYARHDQLVNFPVIKVGQTSGVTAAGVRQFDVSIRALAPDGTSINILGGVETSGRVQQGDSGGIVLGRLDYSHYAVAGIIIWNNTINGIYRSVFTLASNINRDLGLTLR